MGGDVQVQEIFMRDYCNADVHRGEFLSDNEKMNFLFEAARETLRQNSLDIFMDCPSRERAGWLCDSFFSARTAFDLSGNTKIEKNFLENFLLPERFDDIDEGMLPMCYPSDHWNHNYIPNWAMWFVVELEEYLYRSGDRELVDRAKKRVYDLINYFKPFLNEDGLLEKLSHWVFVEWSAANSLVQDVNYPSNMLYAYMLDVASRLYDDDTLYNQAEQIRTTIREQAFDGEYFIDNAKRGKGGRLELTGNHTEVCQYYAFYFGVATPESHPELWARLRDEFGPVRKQTNAYSDVPFANAFIGNYLRMELLSREGLSRKILDESVDFYIPMAEQTGTLWENMTSVASCNHGFASHIIRVLNRDVLGVYAISPVEKRVTLRFVDCGVKSCQGSIPVGAESVDIKWNISDGKINVDLSLPEGYTYECLPADLVVASINEK
jgi:alpha-L-rhamnosidase